MDKLLPIWYSLFIGCGGTNEPSARKDVAKMDEFSSQESRLQKNCDKFFFRCEGTC